MSQQDHYESWESDEINLNMHEVNENTGKKHKKKKKASKKSRKDKDITEPTSPEPTQGKELSKEPLILIQIKKPTSTASLKHKSGS